MNDQRNSLLFEYWEKRATIQQAANQTGIPRSSVGYFFQKFDKYKAKGKSLKRVVVGMDEIERKGEEIKTRLAYKKVIERLKAEERYPEAREVPSSMLSRSKGDCT